MFFNFVGFFLFLIIVFVTYLFFFPKNVYGQNSIMLFASYIFYGWWDWRFLSLIMFSTCLDFFLGIKIHSSKFSSKKFYLIISIVCNIGILSFFKYFNFFISSLQESFSSIGYTFDTWSLSIILPVGISFYTFQTLSYSFDIFNNNLKPTKDFISYSAFVSFFPQLVAGPIERAKTFYLNF